MLKSPDLGQGFFRFVRLPEFQLPESVVAARSRTSCSTRSTTLCPKTLMPALKTTRAPVPAATQLVVAAPFSFSALAQLMRQAPAPMSISPLGASSAHFFLCVIVNGN